MIYTRNKESFKTKTVKSNNSGRNQLVSQNGFNLVQELKKRIQNQTKPQKTSPLNQQHQNQTLNTNSNQQNHSLYQNNKPQSKSTQKISISKNLHKNDKPSQQIAQRQNEPKQDEIQMRIKSKSNGFSKIKKQPFMQMVESSRFLNLNQHIQTKDKSNKQEKIIQMQNNIQNTHKVYQEQNKQERNKKIFESPIQGLYLSGYSSNDRNLEEKQKDIYQQKYQETMSKQNYQNKVKKWKNKQTNQLNSSCQNIKSTNQPNNITHFINQNEVNPYSSTQQQDNCYFQQRSSNFNIQSGLVRESVICQQIFTMPKLSSQAQKQYIQLLQQQISSLKTQCNNYISSIQQFQNEIKNMDQQNKQLKSINQKLSKQLSETQEKLNFHNQNSFVIQKYLRLFTKMRNLHILNAMEMIQTKNYLQSYFTQQNSKYNVIQKNKHEVNMRQSSFLIESEDIVSRIMSMNECIAKVEEIIQVSQKVMEMNKGNSYKVQGRSYVSQIAVKDLEESLIFKDKIIKKLKQDINAFKLVQKDSNCLKSNYSTLGQTGCKQVLKQESFFKPYSYVDEINLLRHQINRLTEENCTFYRKYMQVKKNDKEEQMKRKFPNQSRIKQIQLLINKLDKNSLQQQKPNSKVQYWVKGKTNHQNTQNTFNKINKQKQTKNIILLQQPKLTNYNSDKQIELNSDKQIELNSNKQTNYNSNKQTNFNSDRQNKSKIQQARNLPQKIVHPSIQKISKTSNKIQYSKEEFSQLVRQFKSSLSGLTPQNKHHQSPINKNFTNSNLNYENENQLLTFRTPDHQNNLKNNEPQINLFSHYNNQIQQVEDEKIKNEGQMGENREQEQMIENRECQQDGMQSDSERISRLEYEKEFLASQRENLLKENQKLTQKIKLLQLQLKQLPKINLLKQEIYKLNFQNHQLVDRVVHAQNIALQLQSSSNTNQHQLINIKQSQIMQLKKQNKTLNQTILCLKEQKLKLTETLSSSNKLTHQDDAFSYILNPKFEQLITFLKRLPNQKQQYHSILLNMIQGYQNKVSQLREQNVSMKTKHKHILQIFSLLQPTLTKILKLLSNQKSLKQISSSNTHPSQQMVNKLVIQIKKILSSISKLNTIHLSNNQSQYQSTYHNKTQLNYANKIDYHLMFLRSLIQGIGSSDLQLIEAQLSDYLKQLKKRIPTVLQTQQYQQSNLSSLNTSQNLDQ